MGWRPRIERFAIHKTKRRIILIGDSFLYGWRVSANETVEYYLKEELGPEFEVVNLATRGFGVGQMALVATKIALQLEPDLMIVGFITIDLVRSCQKFSTDTEMAVPKFDLINGELIEPQAVPTPFELWERNQKPLYRLRNAVIGTLYRSRVVNIAMEPFLRWTWRACLTDLNLALLDLIHRQERTSIIYHLAGDPPEKLLDKARARDIKIVSMTSLISTHPLQNGGHPDSALNRLYAHEMAQRVRWYC